MTDSKLAARGPAVQGGVGRGARALARLSFALAAWSAFAWGCGGRSNDDARPAESRPSDDAPVSANGGVGGSPAVTPPPAGMGAAASMSPYCSPIGVPMVVYATYLSDARPLLVDAGAPLADSGASDAGFDTDGGSPNSSLEARVEVEIQIGFPWGTPFEIGPVMPLSDGVQVLTPASSARLFRLSIPAHAAIARVEFRYVCGSQDDLLQVEVALHATSVEARVVAYTPPFE